MSKRLSPPLRLLAALCLTALLLSACGVEVPEQTPLPETEGLRIAVASDLHFDPEHTDKKSGLGAAAYNPELIDALLYDAKEQGAELLLLTGDIVNAGKDGYHAALAEKLQTAEAAGISVYVLPGNHDLAPVSQREFAALYRDFGYGEAYSRDESSLSYCVFRDELCLLMLDTGGYDAAAIDLPNAPKRVNDEAFLSEETLHWAEQILAEAKEKNLPVLCCGHFNLLTEESRDPARSGLYLENGEKMSALLRKYEVPLYVSGHLHTRIVLQEQNLTELVTEYLLSYPTGYSMLDLTEDAVTYTPRRVDVDAWAEACGQRDRVLLHFNRWQQKQLKKYSVQNVNDMAVKNPTTHRAMRRAAEFFYAAMNAYWSGDLANQRETLRAMPGYDPFFQIAEGYAYEWWLKDLIDNASDLLGGFRLELP